MSLYDVLFSIRWGARLTCTEHDKLAHENPEYLKGWLDYQDAIEKQQDKLLSSFERDGISYHDKVFAKVTV